jgi:hypothetical protein
MGRRDDIDNARSPDRMHWMFILMPFRAVLAPFYFLFKDIRESRPPKPQREAREAWLASRPPFDPTTSPYYRKEDRDAEDRAS